ncbi:BTAD domain-containing putative transcriptional regulator [Deinococcus planocerae]|uniref:BTAD domain-containing putative transcriptional regulator n=1 Tax=Deinococcus planocerae TaxID=1737569 RepID=UPI000C7EA261|nr:BTAD domain-containing putative transcriptional regulator [Deinococcus planocerae]
MNTVRKAAQAGEHARGVEWFRALAQPQPEDLRWAGVCFLHLNQLPQAALYLQQALNLGLRGAAVHLASLHFQQGNPTLALSTLDQVNPEELPSSDAALWYRARTRVLWVLGESRETLFALATQAWTLAAGAPLDVQVSVATLLGHLHGHFDEHVPALAYLTFATEHARRDRLAYALMARAAALLALGRLDEAEQALLTEQGEATALLRGELQAQLLWARGDVGRTRAVLNSLLPLAQGHPRTELRLRLGLLTVATLQGDDTQARLQIVRAEHLVRTPYDQALLDHRSGLWQARRGEPGGLSRLRTAEATLTAGGHLRDLVRVRLALAEVEPEARDQHLQGAAETACALPAVPFLAPEWPLLPQIYAHLLSIDPESFESHALLGPPRPPRLILRTLEQAALEVDGQPVRFRLGRTVEVLAFLLRHGEANLTTIQRKLFPDVPAGRAKNYFHQVRVDVASRVAGLNIDYDAKRKLYWVRSDARLGWDVRELETALTSADACLPELSSIEFLPTSESEWAQEEREHLRRWVTQVGLETMERWYQVGEYEKCIKLAERLLPLDPLDEALHTFLLNATWHARGQLAAQHLYRHSAATFIREVGEVPPGLTKLEREWRTLH